MIALLCSEAGSHVKLLQPDALKEQFPWIVTEGIAAATLGVKHEGWFDPWSYLVAMKKKCVSLGVDILDGEVKDFDLGINNKIDKVHIEKKTGDSIHHRTISASKVVNAAGPWASKILEACGSFDYPVKPRFVSLFRHAGILEHGLTVNMLSRREIVKTKTGSEACLCTTVHTKSCGRATLRLHLWWTPRVSTSAVKVRGDNSCAVCRQMKQTMSMGFRWTSSTTQTTTSLRM